MTHFPLPQGEKQVQFPIDCLNAPPQTCLPAGLNPIPPFRILSQLFHRSNLIDLTHNLYSAQWVNAEMSVKVYWKHLEAMVSQFSPTLNHT